MAKKKYPNRKITTFNIDPDVVKKAKLIAVAKEISVSTYIEMLIQAESIDPYIEKLKEVSI